MLRQGYGKVRFGMLLIHLTLLKVRLSNQREAFLHERWSSILIHFSGRDGFPSTLLMVRVPVVGRDDNLTLIHFLGVKQICFTHPTNYND